MGKVTPLRFTHESLSDDCALFCVRLSSGNYNFWQSRWFILATILVAAVVNRIYWWLAFGISIFVLIILRNSVICEGN